jgi:hypothetical protein
MAEPLTLDAILEDLQAIEPLILSYEKKYKVLTPYFYKLYRAGKLEENWDFIDWAGLYDIKLHREKVYRELLAESLRSLPLKENLSEETLLAEVEAV